MLNRFAGSGKQRIAEEIQRVGKAKVSAHVFTFRELVAATDNFNNDLVIGEGGFGRVFKGYIQSIDQVHISRILFDDDALIMFGFNSFFFSF